MSPTKRRWITACFFFLSGILSASWSSRIPDVQNKLHLNNATWGTVLVALPAGMFMGLGFSGWVVTRFGTKKIIVAGCVMVAALLFLIGRAELRIYLMTALFFTGFIRTVLNVALNANAVEVQQLYQRPIIASFHGIWSMACLAAAGIATLLIVKGFSVAGHFLFIATVCSLLAFIFNGINNAPDHIVPEKRPFFVRPQRQLWLLGGIAFCGMMAENTMFDWSINYFEKTLAAAKSKTTLGYTSFILAMTTGRLVGDRLIHRFGHLKMLVLNGLLMSGGFAVAAAWPSLYPAAAGFMLVGVGDSTIVPIVYALAARSSKMPAPYAITAVTTIGYAGFLLAPVIIGGVSELLGMPRALALVALLSLCIPVLALLIRKSGKKEKSPAMQGF